MEIGFTRRQRGVWEMSISLVCNSCGKFDKLEFRVRAGVGTISRDSRVILIGTSDQAAN